MNPYLTTQVSMQRNIPLFLSQPYSFVGVTWPITARLQGAVLLQTSHAWATRPQFAQAWVWQTCQARQLSSRCQGKQPGPDTGISSFTWPKSVVGPLRLGCLSTCSANQDSSGSSALSPLTHCLSALLPADQGVYQPIESGGCSIPSNHRCGHSCARIAC